MHKNNIKLAKTPRRLLTATMGFVFMISLSACKDNSDAPNPSKLFEEKYAEIGDIAVTKGELWNELKWSADSKLEQYINNVILNDEIQKITKVLSNSELTEEEQKLYTTYSNRIVDYVVQDVYNFSYGSDSYWDELEDLSDIDKVTLEAKYADELYSSYNVKQSVVLDLLANEDYLAIAKQLSDVYYPSYAKELFAYSKKVEEVNKADEEDEDSDDDQLGYYTSSNYVTEFENDYANQFDLDLLMIRFSSKQEYEDTLRAFGIKVNNKKYYHIKPVQSDISYSDYCKLYDDVNVKNPNEDVATSYEITNNNTILEIFIEMYNYLYDGYRTGIPSNYTLTGDIELKDLRSITDAIIENQKEETKVLDATLINNVKANNKYSHYTHEELDKISSSLTSYVYNTLDLEDVMYSTSAQSYNNSYYLIFKLEEGENAYDWYESSLTDDEIITKIKEDETLFNDIRESLINNDLTSSAIETYLSDELENVTVKIYNEAVEISYGVNREGYSKTHGKPAHENVLATIEYEDKVWNFNIFADANDENSLTIPGKNTNYGVYEDLEVQYGQTTAMDLIANECIKASSAYAETKANDREFYQDYIEALLYNFTNEAYSSSGFPASIGKYNFLMLYFHSADIDYIIDNFYCVQYASAQLLTDYSNNSANGVISFLKSYSDKAYDSFFSLTGKRFVVYFDENDDNEADDLSTWTPELEALAQELINEVMAEVYASTASHANAFSSIIEEINGSAKVAYNDNPVLVENQWAKYRKAGLNVKLEDFTVTNSTLDVDSNLKNRLAAYVGKYNGVKSNYELIKNNTVPTEFIEKDAEKDPVKTNDGYNILLVTGATLPASAKWEVADEDTLLKDIVVNYNDKDVVIENLTNTTDKLNENQIRLYVLQYVTNGSSSLTPSSISSAISSFLSPVLSRYTSDETQRIIIMYYVESATGNKFTSERFEELLKINQKQADNYSDLYQEVFGTVSYEVDGETYYYDQYANWWEELATQVKNFLVEQE